uniref:Sterile alpha motif domain-containing protein 15-like n=1 Tax=Ciona intestinalis TaxID=7719 RepID=F6ZYD2_CIOIN|nr:sterile alpha motif domain-containing protein 15-like [Ciona intestinalis]|eukprot:XP_002120831.1 sterile alpha motif domain-containing protein 15-like [Ciona intestinalis]
MASPTREDNLIVPTSIHWTCDDVANWIEEIGFPQYRLCFTNNLIDGRKLVLMDASNLPKLGVTDFDHILFIASSVRDLLNIEKPFWNRSIADPASSPMENYLQIKSRTGPSLDKLSYSQFLRRGY